MKPGRTEHLQVMKGAQPPPQLCVWFVSDEVVRVIDSPHEASSCQAEAIRDFRISR